MRASVFLASIVPLLAANAAPGDAFHRAMDREIDGDPRGAAIDFHLALRRGEPQERGEAEVLLARALARLGLPAAASAYDLRVLQRGPADPFYARAVEGAVAADAELGGAIASALEGVPERTADALPSDVAAGVVGLCDTSHDVRVVRAAAIARVVRVTDIASSEVVLKEPARVRRPS